MSISETNPNSPLWTLDEQVSQAHSPQTSTTNGKLGEKIFTQLSSEKGQNILAAIGTIVGLILVVVGGVLLTQGATATAGIVLLAIGSAAFGASLPRLIAALKKHVDTQKKAQENDSQHSPAVRNSAFQEALDKLDINIKGVEKYIVDGGFTLEEFKNESRDVLTYLVRIQAGDKECTMDGVFEKIMNLGRKYSNCNFSQQKLSEIFGGESFNRVIAALEKHIDLQEKSSGE